MRIKPFIIFATLFTMLCAALAFTPAFAKGSPEKKSTVKTPELPGTFSLLPFDHIKGKTDAPVTVIIYASVTCQHCAHWFETSWPDLKKNYVDTGKVNVVFREFITAPAQLAIAGFLIANCGPEDQYFPMIEYLMTEQKNTFNGVKDGNGLETYLAIGKKAGLNTEEELNACLAKKEGKDKLQLAADLASAGNIHGVPNFIIDGKVYKGRLDYGSLKVHIDKLLKVSGSAITHLVHKQKLTNPL
ncbi:MAG: thioredoxin domain-containing protein [Robiginitomaculum sp.]